MTDPIQQDLDVANMVRSDLYPNYARHITGYRERIIQAQAIRIATLEEENKRIRYVLERLLYAIADEKKRRPIAYRVMAIDSAIRKAKAELLKSKETTHG